MTIQNAVSVGASATLTFSGAVVTNSLVTVDGTFVTARDSATQTAANIQLTAGLTLSASANFVLSASVSAVISARATLDGTVTLANNTYLALNAAGSRVATLVASGANTTVAAAAAADATISNSLNVAASRGLSFVGNITTAAAVSIFTVIYFSFDFFWYYCIIL